MGQPHRTLALHIERLDNGSWYYEIIANGHPHCGGIRDTFDAVIDAARVPLKYYSPADQHGAQPDACAMQVAA